MKIAVFHNLPDGGAMRVVYGQVRGLSKNHSVDLYQFNGSTYKNINKYTRELYVYKYDLDSNLPLFLKRFHEDIKNFVFLYFHYKKVAKIIDKRSYDIVLVHSDRWTESPFMFRFLKTPNVYHCHELLRIAYEKSLEFNKDVFILKKLYEKTTRIIRKRIDKKNAQCAGNIITSSVYIKNKVEDAYHRRATALKVGVDTNTFKPAKSIKNKILFIGGRADYKGYDTFGKISKLVGKKHRHRFVELGYGDGEVKIENDYDLAKIYSGSICTLCLARQEPYGLIPLESMACGTPVLAVNEGGYRETVVNGVTGFLLTREPRLFSAKINQMIDDAKLVEKIGEKAREHIIKNFDCNDYNRLLEKEMLQIVNEGKKRK